MLYLLEDSDLGSLEEDAYGGYTVTEGLSQLREELDIDGCVINVLPQLWVSCLHLRCTVN